MKFIYTLWSWCRSGFELLPQFFINLRYGVCSDCDHLSNGWFRQYCDVCSCTLSKGYHPFNKLAHPCQECPLGKWSKIQGANCGEETV